MRLSDPFQWYDDTMALSGDSHAQVCIEVVFDITICALSIGRESMAGFNSLILLVKTDDENDIYCATS